MDLTEGYAQGSGKTGNVANSPLFWKSNAVATIGTSLRMSRLPPIVVLGNSWLMKNAVWLFAANVLVTGAAAATPFESRS